MNNSDIQFNNIFEHILEDLGEPIFTYEENYNYNDMIKEIIKHPLNKSRITLFLILFLIMSLIYKIIFRQKYNDNIFYIISYLSLATISLIITIITTKRSIATLSKYGYRKIYFYDDFLIIKNNKAITELSYEKITNINLSNSVITISLKNAKININKNKLNEEAIDFIKNIQSSMEKRQTSKNIEQKTHKTINININDAKVTCSNIISQNVLNQYYNFKYTKTKLFFHYYIFTLLVIINIAMLLKFYPFHTLIIYTPIIVFISVIININMCVKQHIEKTIKYLEKENIYFYKDFYLIRKNNSIIKYEYNNIKKTLNNNNNIFIITKSHHMFKFTNLYFPIIIDKNELTEEEYNFLNYKIEIKERK